MGAKLLSKNVAEVGDWFTADAIVTITIGRLCHSLLRHAQPQQCRSPYSLVPTCCAPSLVLLPRNRYLVQYCPAASPG